MTQCRPGSRRGKPASEEAGLQWTRLEAFRRRGQSLRRASFTFSPACLRLPLASSIRPSRWVLESPWAAPTTCLARPFNSSALFFALSMSAMFSALPLRDLRKRCSGQRIIRRRSATAVATRLGGSGAIGQEVELELRPRESGFEGGHEAGAEATDRHNSGLVRAAV